MKYTFLLMLSVVFVLSSEAQETLLDKYNVDKIHAFSNSNSDSLLYYATKSRVSKEPCIQKTGALAEASAHYKKGNFKKAETISLNVIEALKNTNIRCKPKLLLTAYNRLFWIKKNEGKYNEAFHFLLGKQEAIELIEPKNEYYHLQRLSASINMASLKEVLGLYPEAIDILKETNTELKRLYTSNLHQSATLKVLHANSLNTIGNTYFNVGKDSIKSFIDSAAVYYKRAFDVAQTFTPKHENSEQLYLLTKVKLFVHNKQYDKALGILSSIHSKGVHSSVNKGFQFYKSLVSLHLKKSDSALFYANNYLRNPRKKANSKIHQIIVYDILANQYNAIQQTDSAYYYSRLGLKELGLLTSNKNKINKAYYQYRFNKIKDLNKSNITSERTTYFKYILIVFVIALIVILLTLYKSKTQKKKLLHKMNSSIEVHKKSTLPPKKDYNIEKEVEEDILRKLEELEHTTEFLSNDFNIKLLAIKLETNTSYLSYILNNSKKQTFKQYITKLRINYLLNELKTNKHYQNYTIEYLAKEIGYTNASAFSRAFKKEVGMTPSVYIKSMHT